MTGIKLRQKYKDFACGYWKNINLERVQLITFLLWINSQNLSVPDYFHCKSC